MEFIHSETKEKVICNILSCGCVEDPYNQKKHVTPCKIVGHWKEDYHNEYYRGPYFTNVPIPNSTILDQTDEIKALQKIHNIMTESKLWLLHDDNYDDNYKNTSYMGESKCRCCDVLNGSHEYKFDGWVFPEGYVHYLIEHNVAIHPEFSKFLKEYDFNVFDELMNQAIENDPNKDLSSEELIKKASACMQSRFFSSMGGMTFSN
jgi:hypothetical protein